MQEKDDILFVRMFTDDHEFLVDLKWPQASERIKRV